MNIQAPYCAISKEFPWPRDRDKVSINSKIRDFVRKLVADILAEKKSKGLVFTDDWCTAPKNPEELQKLIVSSFETINDAWEEIFSSLWKTYTRPTLVLYDGMTTEGDIEIKKATGPCYIPKFEKIFLDPSFFDHFKENYYPWTEDFTIFYIIAHEVAHHVQDMLFWSHKITYSHEWKVYTRDLHSIIDLRVFSLYHHEDSRHQAEQIVEIHADYLTWVVTHHANKRSPFLHENDIREWIETAIAVGDDMIRFRNGWNLDYEKFSHGRCDQRALAFANWLKYWNIMRFSTEEIVALFIEQWINSPPEHTVQLFERLARKWE